MTINTRVKTLEAEKAERDALTRAPICSCGEIVIVKGTPTAAQQAAFDARVPCVVHTDVISVIEVPPIPEWMQAGKPRPVRLESEE